MLLQLFPRVASIHAIAIPMLGFSDLIAASVYVLGKDSIALIGKTHNSLQKRTLLYFENSFWAQSRYAALDIP
jgi:hypothetical protein